MGGGDLNERQRREALDRFVALHRPLTALSIFLAFVALEDFIRDLAGRLADLSALATYFPNISELAPTIKPPTAPFKRFDKDAFPSFDAAALNAKFQRCVGVQPIPVADYARLRDLALVRHTVAHHGAIFRPIDVPRLQYYDIDANVLINPPVDFAKDTCRYLYDVGHNLELAIRKMAFAVVLKALGGGWEKAPIVLELIELFDFFGHMLDEDTWTGSPSGRELLLARSVAQLQTEHP